MSITEEQIGAATISSNFERVQPKWMAPALLERVDALRIAACRQLEQSQRGAFGQFLTPAPVAKLMASMLNAPGPVVSLLDAGAGVGSLLAAAVDELCGRQAKPEAIHITAYEIDPILVTYLHETIALCRRSCDRAEIKFFAEVKAVDFLADAALCSDSLFSNPLPKYSAAILNPPYKKINADSQARRLLRQIGIETSNLYTGFLAAAIQLLAPNGEMITITPRSFCNGTYFRGFREDFLREMVMKQIHLFDSRQDAFRDDSVLQETIIVHSIKDSVKPSQITVSTSAGADDELILSRRLSYQEVVHPDDSERFIRVVSDGIGQQIVDRMARFQTKLTELGLTVSTGRVVDFRAADFLQHQPLPETVPLIYPVNIERGQVVWPKQSKKPQYLSLSSETEALLVPNENYVLVKRFSSKEQKRRVVSAVLEGNRLPGDQIGLENHLNYYHRNGHGIDLALAKGLNCYLNSTLVDAYFRQFNGHTQVNAGDLRSLHYPNQHELERLGRALTDDNPTQEQIDFLMEQEFFPMTDETQSDPIAAKKRIEEALEILRLLGMPKAQTNERSALTLLALLHLTPGHPWSEAESPMIGIASIIGFMDQHYGKKYATGSRETVRRQTVHQFLDAGLIVANPDAPQRPTNSGDFVYQIDLSALEMLRTYGTSEWEQNLNTYLASRETLTLRYAQEREMVRIPIQIAPGQTITLSPGGQNVLVEQIIHEFAPRFTPGAKMIYVGDTDQKFAYFDQDALTALGVLIDAHGKMPDVIISDTKRNWLILIEAVTSHGPINPKRQTELKKLFSHSSAGIVMVTAFLSRKAMVEYLPEIAWETEVWFAEAPSHLLHFNGERFLGPY